MLTQPARERAPKGMACGVPGAMRAMEGLEQISLQFYC